MMPSGTQGCLLCLAALPWHYAISFLLGYLGHLDTLTFAVISSLDARHLLLFSPSLGTQVCPTSGPQAKCGCLRLRIAKKGPNTKLQSYLQHEVAFLFSTQSMALEHDLCAHLLYGLW